MRYLIALVLAGCASTTDVVPYGNGLYMITASARGDATSVGDLQSMAEKEATAYCARQGKTMQAQQQSTMQTTAALSFTCSDGSR
jgi:hypothetical protein